MAAAAAVASLTDHFSLAEITWRIKNFSLAICPLKRVIDSNEFEISGQVPTLWRLSLNISHEKNAVTVRLKMLGPELNLSSLIEPENVMRLSWMSSLLDSNGEASLSSESKHHFITRDEIPMDTFALSKIVKSMSHAEEDDLVLRCLMLVHHGGKVDFTANVPYGLIDLSNTLAKIPVDYVFPNIVVNVGRTTFCLHKDMLRHTRYLTSLIDQQHTEKITLLNFEEASTELILRYIYSGNLNYILGTPRLRICEDIKRFGIPELEKAYPKEKIELESAVVAVEYVLSWRIRNIELLEGTEDGPSFEEDQMNTRWQVRMLPRGKPEGSQMERDYVFFEVLLLASKMEKVNLSVRFATLNKKNAIHYSRRQHKMMTVGDKLELPFFKRGGTLMKTCLIDKDLSMKITLSIDTGVTTVELVKVVERVPFDLNSTLALNLLSRKMNSILNEPQCPDVYIHTGNRNFPVHKFVLASRSPVFKDRVAGRISYLTIPIKSHFIRVFLEHLYTGLYPDIELETNCYMYEFGFVYKIPHLIARCKHELNPDTVLDVLAVADSENLVNVKNKAATLAARIGLGITDHTGWDDFLSKKTALACHLLDFIKNYRN